MHRLQGQSDETRWAILKRSGENNSVSTWIPADRPRNRPSGGRFLTPVACRLEQSWVISDRGFKASKRATARKNRVPFERRSRQHGASDHGEPPPSHYFEVTDDPSKAEWGSIYRFPRQFAWAPWSEHSQRCARRHEPSRSCHEPFVRNGLCIPRRSVAAPS
jgi:hypothetical protein